MRPTQFCAALLVLTCLTPLVKADEANLADAFASASASVAVAKKPPIIEGYALKPNESNDGPLYRALTGPTAVTDAAGTRSVEFGGMTLLRCKLGNGSGPAYNDYDCTIFFSRVTGAAAADVYDALGDDKSVTVRNDDGAGCSHMHCRTFTDLTCSSRSSCRLVSRLTGWDE